MYIVPFWSAAFLVIFGGSSLIPGGGKGFFIFKKKRVPRVDKK